VLLFLYENRGIVAFFYGFSLANFVFYSIMIMEAYMIKLEPHQVCPYGSVCKYKVEFTDVKIHYCEGLNPDRNCVFICELWAENYEKER